MKTPTIGSIIRTARQKNPAIDDHLLRTAERLARTAHEGQMRATGEPFITHPLAVACTLADLGMDTATIAAGLLHDVLEDTSVTRRELEQSVGAEVAWICDGVTKLKRFHYRGEQWRVENLRKFFLAMAEDIRVVVVKLADRLHNMETLQCFPMEKCRRIAAETMDIYAPIADRLGIWTIKARLEDLSFPFVDHDAYAWIKQKLSSRIREREEYLQRIAPKIIRALKKEGITPRETQMRAKSYWSSYRKLKLYDMDVDQLYDLVAVRLIVGNVEECYAALGIVHSLWPPVPGRIKDYIASPKPNGYRALHTTVFADGGEMMEVQIRTAAMHEEAKRGIAAHWAYVEAGKPRKGFTADRRRMEWVRQLQEWQNETKETEEFFESLKIDFFKHRIFVLTPKGDIIDLPDGATPLDFAYHIHSDIGHHCAGALVNGKLTALDEPLESGAVVSVITRPDAHPSRDWLTIARTSSAKHHIRHWLKEQAANKQTAESVEIPRERRQARPRERPPSPRTATADIIVEGEERLALHRARCCSPLPGQPIVGYVTQRGTISIHRHHCPSLRRGSSGRRLAAAWKESAQREQILRLSVEDRVGMLKEISAAISEAGLNITDIHTAPKREGSPLATIDATLLVGDVRKLERALRRLRETAGVIAVRRL